MNNINTKIVSIVLGIIVIAGSFIAVFGSSLKNLSNDEPKIVTDKIAGEVENQKSSEVTKSPDSNKAALHDLAEITTHNSAKSCWSTINGGVYDLTSWVDNHPGGRAAILMICGKDGSPLYNTQHGGESEPASWLAKYKIGTLKS